MTTQETNTTKRAIPRLTGVLAMAHAADVANSLEFYKKLGFGIAKTFKVEGRLQWACLTINGSPQLMLARSARAMNPDAQDVLFYIYVTKVSEYRERLKAAGVAVGDMKFPPNSPTGEFRVDDPDGYTLFVTQTKPF